MCRLPWILSEDQITCVGQSPQALTTQAWWIRAPHSAFRTTLPASAASEFLAGKDAICVKIEVGHLWCKHVGWGTAIKQAGFGGYLSKEVLRPAAHGTAHNFRLWFRFVMGIRGRMPSCCGLFKFHGLAVSVSAQSRWDHTVPTRLKLTLRLSDWVSAHAFVLKRATLSYV